jgi:hypothetical protein
MAPQSPRTSEHVPTSPRAIEEERERLLREKERAQELKRIEEVKKKAGALRQRLGLAEKKRKEEMKLVAVLADEFFAPDGDEKPNDDFHQPANNNTNDNFADSDINSPKEGNQLEATESAGEFAGVVHEEEEEEDELTMLLNKTISAQQASLRYEKFLAELRSAFSSVLQMVISFELNHSQVDLLKEVGMFRVIF